MFSILTRYDGATIAYNRISGKNPGIIFVHGLLSDMNGNKALVIEEFCVEHGLSFVRFDTYGHGKSSGLFEDGTIGRWAGDLIAVLDELTEGPQIIVGSSMGGWLMLLAAIARPDRVAALLGLAAAPDFTEYGIIATMTDAQRDDMECYGQIMMPDCDGGPPLIIRRELLEDGKKHCLLGGEIIIDCPVRLIHGQRDMDVPWQTSLRLSEMLRSQDVSVTFLKSSGHRLSEPADLEVVRVTLEQLL